MEETPQVKLDEEYPLLKVETGGGDGKPRNTTLVNNVTKWNVTCTPNKSWCTRWPEFVSAFWMSLILLAISFLVFYALGMSLYRRQPVVIVRCNNSKPGSEVFYHHIIPREAHVPFSLFSNYLSFMARQYPSLRFSVYFLINDSLDSPLYNSRYPNSRFINRLAPRISNPFTSAFTHKRDINDFQKKYQNVKICVILLSKYMALTPLKYKWKIISQDDLSFYTRIFEVWKNGGFGFDLVSFNNQFKSNGVLDKRIDNILKNLNTNTPPEKYVDVFNFLDDEEEDNSLSFSKIFHLIDHLMDETFSFFNIDFITAESKVNETSKIRTHRSKRGIEDNISKLNNTNILGNNDTFTIFNKTKTNTTIMNSSNGIHQDNKSLLNNNLSVLLSNTNKSTISNEIPHNNLPLIIYDVPESIERSVPAYFFKSLIQSYPSNLPIRTVRKMSDQKELQHKKTNYLLISPEGRFVAASSRHHPFLSELLTFSCLRLHPKIAIKETLWSQCSGILRNDFYCENIRVIYNVI